MKKIPIGFISSLMSLESLAARLPFLSFVLDLPDVVTGFLQGVLPALAMTVFMALLPTILTTMGRIQGISTTVELQISVFKRYFVFQLVNFFLLTVFASSVLDELDSMISNPTEIPTLLARALPASANGFVNYIMLRALNANIFEMLDVPRMFLSQALLKIASTPAECLAAWHPDPFKYGRLLPEALLIAIVGFCFSTIQPVILPFTAAYFATLMMWHKNHYVFQHVTPMESGGAFWPLIFNRLILGMVISQLCLLGIFGLKEVAVEALMMIPLIIGTLVFWQHCRNVYSAKMDNIHLYNAIATDHARSALSEDEKRALVEGHELAPVAADILPMLMPERYADCFWHDKRVAKIARGAKKPSTDSEKAASARGNAIEGDYGLLYHYKSDGYLFSDQKKSIKWTDVASFSTTTTDVPACAGIDAISSIASNPVEALSDRGLTAEQEAHLTAAMLRRAEAERIRTDRQQLSVFLPSHSRTPSSVPTSPSLSISPRSPMIPLTPTTPSSPTLRLATALSASCAGCPILMAKYTQQELAPSRYAVELLDPVWSAEYLHYRHMKLLARNGEIEDDPEDDNQDESDLSENKSHDTSDDYAFDDASDAVGDTCIRDPPLKTIVEESLVEQCTDADADVELVAFVEANADANDITEQSFVETYAGTDTVPGNATVGTDTGVHVSEDAALPVETCAAPGTGTDASTAEGAAVDTVTKEEMSTVDIAGSATADSPSMSQNTPSILYSVNEMYLTPVASTDVLLDSPPEPTFGNE